MRPLGWGHATGVEHPRPELPSGAEHGDGAELVRVGRGAEPDGRRGLSDAEAGCLQRAQIGDTGGQRPREFLSGGGTGIGVAGAVDGEHGTFRQPRGEVRGQCSRSIEGVGPAAPGDLPDRIESQPRAGRLAVAAFGDDRGQRPGGIEVRVGCQHDRREIEEDAGDGRVERLARPTLDGSGEFDRGHPALEILEHGAIAGSRVVGPVTLANVPPRRDPGLVHRQRRADRVDLGRGVERLDLEAVARTRHQDVVEGPPSQDLVDRGAPRGTCGGVGVLVRVGTLGGHGRSP